MTANPITYQEIEAFARLTGAELQPWEVDLICRLDDAALMTLAAKAPKASGEPAGFSPSDTEGVRGLMRGLAAKKKGEKEGRNKGGPA